MTHKTDGVQTSPTPSNARRSAGEQEIDRWRNTAAYLQKNGLYDARNEHDNCGVGMVASIDGKPRREVVLAGIEALKSVWHRGAVDADGKTGDGAGIHVQIPQDFFRDHIERTGHEPREGRIGVGMVFLPRTDFAAQERCRVLVEREILQYGYIIYGWRRVPINTDVIGEKANATRPEIEQVMIATSKETNPEQFEVDLYVIRRRIEKAVEEESIKDFYICSLSGRSIIYKGMFLAEQLTSFYPDLLDERFTSNFAIFHQRYSTNTFPTWPLAQPFRVLAHNGEINTLNGNINWMKAHECRLESDVFGRQIDYVKPVIRPGSSDSAALDAVFELLVRAGRDLPMVKTMMIPEAWGHNEALPQEVKDLYTYLNAVMEPWDGPAAVCAYDGRWLVAGLDRNGLRPLRYAVTEDGFVYAGSETGMIRLDEATIIEKGRVGPGQMLAIDLKEGKLFHDSEIKHQLAASRPFGSWVGSIKVIDDIVRSEQKEVAAFTPDEVRRRQLLSGQTMEDLELILHPMIAIGKEAVGSMGDDTPLSVLSDRYRGLHHFFRQNFSQVTNPPIDSLRERRVMSLATRLGNLGNILDEAESQCRLLQLDSPVLSNAQFEAMRDFMQDTAVEVACTFDPHGGEDALRRAIEGVCVEAEEGVRGGATHVILSDRNSDAQQAPIPMILATGAVHTHLLKQKLRTFTSLNVQAGDCMDVHSFGVLIGIGATTVNAYLAQESIADRHVRGLFGDISLEEAVKRYIQAVDEGLLKIISKLGIAVISSYRGGCNFEALGLSRTLVDEFFPGMPSRLSGIGLSGIQQKILDLHARAWRPGVISLPIGGFYRYRNKGEPHGWEAEGIHTLQTAVARDSYSTYKKYSQMVSARPPIALRDLLDFRGGGITAVALDEIESITAIRKRFVTPAMSLGALSPEAHGTLNIAMNRIGAKSDSGEGGEDPERFTPRPNGDNANSAIKQVASGRFGVTAEYLNKCREIEIKVAQGAKPGEGGQLPGFKVTDLIARLRHSTPGVSLISPPPHHDIYSIEDLAQLIYDLKQINAQARVCVKLVARSGIGTIAAGVAKAKADIILISGHSGGTGASPQSSIKYAGIPWEMGLSEVHQVLTLNKLRHRVRLRTDGGIKTGRDVVIAAILGAEEYGVGTASLIAVGCLMVRQCHSNTCPVGVCTQDTELRKKYTGTPEKVVNLFSFIAEEVREILAALGVRTLDEVIGRTDLLAQVSRGAPHLDDLDLNPLLARADSGSLPAHSTLKERNEVPDTLDAQIIEDAVPLFRLGEKMQLQYNIRNTHRAIGTRLSSKITNTFGMLGLEPDHLTVRLRGSAGQSLGAWLVQGVKLEVFGDANDYVGKGLSGGTIIVRPMTKSKLVPEDNAIIGNTVLYGAIKGKLFANGRAGERFAVRNSGAISVVEGCGANGCEYMTGGVAVILGPISFNFAAGMSGGMVYLYDPEDKSVSLINHDQVHCFDLSHDHYIVELHSLIEEHAHMTQSPRAWAILANWKREQRHFRHIIPREILPRLAVPLDENGQTARPLVRA